MQVDKTEAAKRPVFLINTVLGVRQGTPDLAADDSLLVIVVLGDDLNPVSNQVHGVEPDAKLADEVHVPALLHLLQEGCGRQGKRGGERM